MSIKDKIKGFKDILNMVSILMSLVKWYNANKEKVKNVADTILDLLEELAKITPTEVDDEALGKLREKLGIPDNDVAAE